MNFENEKLKEILINFYNLTNVRFSMYDDEFNKITAYPEESCDFCTLMKSVPESRALCKKDDIAACEECGKSGKLYMYKCHCGLVEVVAPIKMNDITIGYIMFGQICEKGSDKSQIYEYAKKFVNDEITLRNSVDNIINKTETQIKSAANILEICTCYLCLYNLIRIDDDNLITGLSDYINTNLTKDLSVEHLCSAMKISRSRLYEISHKYYKMSIAKYIRKKRVELSAELLKSPGTSVSEAAHSSGFYDSNYFSKIFKSETGITPGEYKKKNV